MTVRLEDHDEILDPIAQGVKNSRRVWWLGYLRERLYIKRKGVCDACGERMAGFDLHEALFSRKILPHDKQLCLFSEYNCLILHRDCHIPQPPTREEALEILLGYYGDELWKWMERLEKLMKVKPDLLNQRGQSITSEIKLGGKWKW